jgi:uncharacterized protein (UPF0332 family)
MAFADDLLEQAYHLARRERKNPTQASLRRAVSTAYYALFHLLIDEAVGNWAVERQRSVLARTFDHGRMKKVCEDYVNNYYSSGQPSALLKLKNVAHAFLLLQEQRHKADYDNSFEWSRTNAVAAIDLASSAFSDWRSIRKQVSAQDYLLALFLPKIR